MDKYSLDAKQHPSKLMDMDIFASKHDDAEKYRVLVIDDNEMELKLYANGLARHFTMSFARTTEKAWELLNRAPIPDAIILDILMPDEDGLQFCERLRENPYTNNIPIIFMSSLSGANIKAQAFELGGADFVVKPPVIDELVARINRHAAQYRKTKRLEALIFIDPLTHLPNAAKFEEVLKQEWSRCARYWHHLSLLLIHLEDMQWLKKEYGKDEYYAMTASIADALSGIGARPGDLFASLDDDCFGLLLSDCSTSGAQIKAQQIIDTFSQPNFVVNQEFGDHKIECTIAVAVAAPAGGGVSAQLYQAADNVLFKARKERRSGIVQLGYIMGVDDANDS
ncbi:GGDEF domain-containing response regulator [Agaribacter flavus]|uniref:Diguanylate cyclase domain-containing protein n=1 Tax=Agaribacter flavus TaxID=1902781 RepID=A0ABV7FW69_9ALTE